MKELEIKKNNLYTLFEQSRLLKNYFCLVSVNDLITEILQLLAIFFLHLWDSVLLLRYKEPPVIT